MCDDLSLVGNYTLALQGTYGFSNGEDSRTDYVYFKVTLKEPPRTYVPGSEHFYFALADHSMDLTEGWTLEVGGPDPVFGRYGDEMSIELDLGSAASFATYNKTTKTLQIRKGALKEENVGEYQISALARFVNLTYSEYFEASFTLRVRNDNPAVVESERIASISDWVKVNQNVVKEDLELEDYHEGQPVPYIKSLTSTGMLTIEWDRKVQALADFATIGKSRVAVRNSNSTTEDPYSLANKDYFPPEDRDRRQLFYRHYDKLRDEEMEEIGEAEEEDYEWYLILEALEIKVKPSAFSDERYLNLTWEMLSFDSKHIFIQLFFDYPSFVSQE